MRGMYKWKIYYHILAYVFSIVAGILLAEIEAPLWTLFVLPIIPLLMVTPFQGGTR